PDGVRAGRDDLVCCLRPSDREQSQKGRICPIARSFWSSTNCDKLSDWIFPRRSKHKCWPPSGVLGMATCWPQIPPDLVVGRVRRIPIPSGGEDWQVEHPV